MRGARPGGGAAGPGCGNCGSQYLETIRPGWVEGLGTWLRSRGRWPSSQVCRRCGHVTPAGSVAYLVPRKRWWPVPSLAGVSGPDTRGDPGPDILMVLDPARGCGGSEGTGRTFPGGPVPCTACRHLAGPRQLGGWHRGPVGSRGSLTSSPWPLDPAAGHAPVRSGPVRPGRSGAGPSAQPWPSTCAGLRLQEDRRPKPRGRPGGRPADRRPARFPFPTGTATLSVRPVARVAWFAWPSWRSALVLQSRDLAPSSRADAVPMSSYVDGVRAVEEARARATGTAATAGPRTA